MTVTELADKLQLETVTCPEPTREFSGVYIGDLLSWVMGRANADQVWITIMSNINIIAVASLTDVACILLAEGVTLDDDLRKVAQEKGVNVFSSSQTAYEIALALAALNA